MAARARGTEAGEGTATTPPTRTFLTPWRSLPTSQPGKESAVSGRRGDSSLPRGRGFPCDLGFSPETRRSCPRASPTEGRTKAPPPCLGPSGAQRVPVVRLRRGPSAGVEGAFEVRPRRAACSEPRKMLKVLLGCGHGPPRSRRVRRIKYFSPEPCPIFLSKPRPRPPTMAKVGPQTV